MKLLTASQMREMDRRAIEDVGIPSVALMELAGSGTARHIIEKWYPEGDDVLVVAGRGNNGGDGLVVARHMFLNGARVAVVLLGRMEDLKGDAAVNARAADALGISIYEITGTQDFPHVEALFRQADIIVDAIFGTGLSREVTGVAREAISAINASDAKIVSVDIPSGLSADTGTVMGLAVKADLTVTFGYPKIGQFTAPGFEYCGEVEVVDISLPRDEVPSDTMLLDDNWVVKHMPSRPEQGHKGTFGHVLAMAGSPGKLGAALMVGQAAARSGAGLVTLGVPGPLMDTVMMRITELMATAISPPDRLPEPDDLDDILAALDGKNALAVGPGIPVTESMRELLVRLLEEVEVPVIIDADGLNLLAHDTEIFSKIKQLSVLTPHPGEISRLTGLSVNEIQSNRVDTARKYASEWNAVVVLKGARTIIATPQGRAYINPTGNSGMATGGSGDVLTGVIASLLAQGASPEEAAACGVYVHGMAGDLAAEKIGERALLATDIISYLPKALKDMDLYKEFESFE